MADISVVDEANSFLQQFDGQYAQLEFYMVSHNTLVISLKMDTKPSSKGYVVFNFITSLIAPEVGWRPCEIRVDKCGEDEFVVEDKNVGLKIKGNFLYVGSENLGKMHGWY